MIMRIPSSTAALPQSALPMPKRARVIKLTPRDSRYSHHWVMANGRPIRVATIPRAQISTDWDGERMRCWPRLTAAQAEVRVAKVICAVLGCVLGAVALAVLS